MEVLSVPGGVLSMLNLSPVMIWSGQVTLCALRLAPKNSSFSLYNLEASTKMCAGKGSRITHLRYHCELHSILGEWNTSRYFPPTCVYVLEVVEG